MLSDYQPLVMQFVRDDASRIAPEDRDSAIRMAVARYSAARPRTVAGDIADVSGMVIALPAEWDADFSKLLSLEHPVGRVPPALLGPDDWAFYRDVDGLKLMLASSLAEASTVRATFTRLHVVSDTEDTVPLADREPVAKWAASLLCDQLAAFYANDSDTTIGVDRAQGQTRSQAYAARAREYRKGFTDVLGVDDKTSAPACAVASMRPTASDGQPRLFHPRRFR